MQAETRPSHYQVNVAGWARAAIAVAATTNGSIADKTWDESSPLCSAPLDIAVGGFIPNESNEEFPSLHCDPTLPINGDVEHPFIDRPPFLNPLFENEEHENEEEYKEELGSLGVYVCGFITSFELLGAREMKGIGVIE